MRWLIGIGLFLLVLFSFINGFIVANIFSSETQVAITSLEKPKKAPLKTAKVIMPEHDSAQAGTTDKIESNDFRDNSGFEGKQSPSNTADQALRDTLENGPGEDGDASLNQKDMSKPTPNTELDTLPVTSKTSKPPDSQPDSVSEYEAQLPTALKQRPYIVQVASFLDQKKAANLVNRINRLDMTARVSTNSVGEQIWHAVYLGPFSIPSDAYAVARKIQAQFNINPLVRLLKKLPVQL